MIYIDWINLMCILYYIRMHVRLLNEFVVVVFYNGLNMHSNKYKWVRVYVLG